MTPIILIGSTGSTLFEDSNSTNITIPLDCPESDEDTMDMVNKFSFWVEGVIQVSFIDFFSNCKFIGLGYNYRYRFTIIKLQAAPFWYL